MCAKDCGRCEDCETTDVYVVFLEPTPPTTMPPLMRDGGEEPR